MNKFVMNQGVAAFALLFVLFLSVLAMSGCTYESSAIQTKEPSHIEVRSEVPTDINTHFELLVDHERLETQGHGSLKVSVIRDRDTGKEFVVLQKGDNLAMAPR